jgi:trehalose 6-phosphate synthase/phosphatase
VFLDPQVHSDTYKGYCKQVMWPVFHNVDQLDHIHAAWNHPMEWESNMSRWQAAFKTSTCAFDELLSSLLEPGDIVWVHDYHLMLLPKLLRMRNLDISIVYFVHIPFPTSQIFRSLPDALELLESMTCADLVGFHSFDHTRHFLNACKRMLGLPSKTISGGLLVVVVGEREVIVSMSHVSIEPLPLEKAVADPETQKMAAAIREKYKDKKIIVSVDVLQRCTRISTYTNLALALALSLL